MFAFSRSPYSRLASPHSSQVVLLQKSGMLSSALSKLLGAIKTHIVKLFSLTPKVPAPTTGPHSALRGLHGTPWDPTAGHHPGD